MYKVKDYLTEHFKYWGDCYFYLGSLVSVLCLGYYLTQYACLSIQDTAQILIIFTTFAVLFHSVFIKDNFSSYRRRPVIDLLLNFNEPDCHLTETHIRFQTTTNQVGRIEIPTYYLRLRVRNLGKTTLKNVEAILEKVEKNGKELTSFLPLTLIWALTEVQANRGLTQIPQGTFRTLDLLNLMKPEQTQQITDERYQAMVGKMAVCSVVQPNTNSDILEKGKYTFYLSVVSENQEPYFAKFSVKYDGLWSDDIKTMFKKHIKLTLVSKGKNKNRVYRGE